MNGLDLRLARLFAKGSLFLSALDHGQVLGVPQGLENISSFINSLSSSPVDGFILNPGIANKLESFNPEKFLILRATHSGSALGGNPVKNNYFLSPSDALSIGADAVILMVILGHEEDSQSLKQLVRAVSDYHKLGIPVIAEMLPYKKEDYTSVDMIANISRIGAELGADIIKTYYTEDFTRVTNSCPVPVIIAGGKKETNFLDMVESSKEQGAQGLAVGRNLFQSDDPVLMIKELSLRLGR